MLLFLEAVRQHSLIPSVVRMDRGTENVHIEICQQSLRDGHGDSLAGVAVIYDSSNHNQRIERFWSYLRQTLLQDYMNLFKDYLLFGLVDSANVTHMECLILFHPCS